MSERQQKRAQFEDKKKKSFLPVLMIGLVVLAGAGLLAWQSLAVDAGKYPTLTGSGGQLSIPLSQVQDGQAHFFSYKAGESSIDFFVVKSSDGVFRAAFDACDVCYHAKQGYRQEGDDMVCNNCGMKFHSTGINEVKGGCNPAPLVRIVSGDRLIIAEKDLLSGSRYFQGS